MVPRSTSAVVIMLAVAASAAGREGIHNGSFEHGLHASDRRPSHWYVGFPGDLAPFPGTWRLRQPTEAERSTVLEIGCESDEETCLVSQIVDLPAATTSGVTISLRMRVQRRTDHGWVGAQLAASAVAPELPLILPEFGFRADGVYSESEQEEYLRRVYSELREHPVRAAVLYSLYDQAYLGAPPWFKEAFGGVGLIGLDGTPKRSYALFHRTRRQIASPIVAEPRMQCVPSQRTATGRSCIDTSSSSHARAPVIEWIEG